MATTSYTEDDLKRLSWQCRRGIKEVEVLLAPFFEQHFISLSARDQDSFVKLLEQPDVELFEWFTQRAAPQNSEFQQIVNVILSRVAS